MDAKFHVLEEGSIIVTLKADYLATLPAVTYTLGIKSAVGTALTKFTVAAKALEHVPSKPGGTDSPQPDKIESPSTGYRRNMRLLIALLFVAGGTLTVFGVKRRKGKAVK